MAASNEQIRNTYATVEAMVNGAAQVMQRLQPSMKVRSWNELTPKEKEQMVAALHKMLTPLAVILTGRPGAGEQATGVVLDG